MTNPPRGLDPSAVAAHLPSANRRFDAATTTTGNHARTHGGYVAWSGGKDSTVVVDLVRRTHPTFPVVWFHSGLEFPDTETYIRDLANEWSLNLTIIHATPDALSIMEQSGAWDHTRDPDWTTPDLHEALITRPAATARKQFGPAELWGLRADESKARRALLSPGQGTYTRRDGTHTYSPIWDWKDIHVNGYLAARNIPENPTYARLKQAGANTKDLRVGLAFDGNNLQFGRAIWLRRCYPDLYQTIAQRLPRIREWS
jgi:phosphoadenosine phosphosulfate reductase